MSSTSKRGPLSFSFEQIEQVHSFYLQCSGNSRKCSRECEKVGLRVTEKTIRKWAVQLKWAEELPKLAKRASEKTIRSVAEARAKIIRAIDLYTDKQLEYIERGAIKGHEREDPGIDPAGLEKLAKLRELLTGNVTDRAELSGKSDDELRARLERLRAKYLEPGDDEDGEPDAT